MKLFVIFSKLRVVQLSKLFGILKSIQNKPNLCRQINFLMQAILRHHSSSQQMPFKKVKHFSYQSSDRIGKGYSSVVYKGNNSLTNQTVALKAIDMKGVRDAASKEMLDCQIEALTKLKHDNVLKCFEVVREPSHCYIVTEFCDQGDLSAFLKKKGRLNEQEALKLTKDIVSGLIHIAEGGFIHRDMKLANIFMNGGKALIADFGFAKKHRGPSQKERYNVGSPLYMSPEALKKNMYSIKNDIWSIGIMLYELLHGETPWNCRTEKQLMDKMVRIPVSCKDSLKLSSPTKKFIKKCLEVNQENRMSLQDLKDWNLANSYENIKQGKMEFQSQKGATDRQPLSQVSNRIQQRSQSITNYSKGISKGSSQNEKVALCKATLQKNNSLILKEINTFRLLFKIQEKLKKVANQEKQLLNALGNQVLKRVNQLMDFLSPQKQNYPGNSSNHFGVNEPATYINEQSNPTVKKYKNVVKQYHKKYNCELSTKPLGRQVSLSSLMREILQNGFVKDGISEEQSLVAFWMLQFCNLGTQVRKQYLQGVIEAKGRTLSQTYLKDRVKAL